VTARAGQASSTLQLVVGPNPVATVEVKPALATVRTGDVVRLAFEARDRSGTVVPDVLAEWMVNPGSGLIEADGAFVASEPGTYRAVGAFVALDIEVSKKIPDEDDLVDDLYNQVYRELVMIMFSNPETIDRANYLMWAAHNLERMADRVTNICERTIYAVTAEMMEFRASDDELVKS